MIFFQPKRNDQGQIYSFEAKRLDELILSLERATGIALKKYECSRKIALMPDSSRRISKSHTSPLFRAWLQLLLKHPYGLEIFPADSAFSDQNGSCYLDLYELDKIHPFFPRWGFALTFAHETMHAVVESDDFDQVKNQKRLLGAVSFSNIIAYQLKLPLRIEYSINFIEIYSSPYKHYRLIMHPITQKRDGMKRKDAKLRKIEEVPYKSLEEILSKTLFSKNRHTLLTKVKSLVAKNRDWGNVFIQDYEKIISRYEKALDQKQQSMQYPNKAKIFHYQTSEAEKKRLLDRFKFVGKKIKNPEQFQDVIDIFCEVGLKVNSNDKLKPWRK